MAQGSGLKSAQLSFHDAQTAVVARVSEADSKLFADNLSGTDFGLAQAMSEQLLPRVAVTGQSPLQFVICLARRGRIYVRARYEGRAWSISLQAEQAGTRQWLIRQQQHCQQHLARTLGQPVSLQLMQARRG